MDEPERDLSKEILEWARQQDTKLLQQLTELSKNPFEDLAERAKSLQDFANHPLTQKAAETARMMETFIADNAAQLAKISALDRLTKDLIDSEEKWVKQLPELTSPSLGASIEGFTKYLVDSQEKQQKQLLAALIEPPVDIARFEQAFQNASRSVFAWLLDRYSALSLTKKTPATETEQKISALLDLFHEQIKELQSFPCEDAETDQALCKAFSLGLKLATLYTYQPLNPAGDSLLALIGGEDEEHATIAKQHSLERNKKLGRAESARKAANAKRKEIGEPLKTDLKEIMLDAWAQEKENGEYRSHPGSMAKKTLRENKVSFERSEKYRECETPTLAQATEIAREVAPDGVPRGRGRPREG